ncbi:MAG: patatin-like phospholipase family protein [Gammaproteobacteria bacterium]|nr:patatin-like phospholipase family protein [Gammaproteobacteria bacterium]
MRNKTRKVNLALQGGGSHGAFTWGVLDRLLKDERLEIEGISGTSSGAMNAIVLADGLAKGGRRGARLALRQFWEQVSKVLPRNLSPLALSRLMSPYDLNPLGLNPLRDILAERIDFDRSPSDWPVKLFISATEVQTGKIKIFTNHHLSLDALLASACLPSLHHAVEIDGKVYWDGGYSGNPPIFPLIFECRSPDVVVVMLQPLYRPDTPYTAAQIRTRAVELGFSAAFLREMRAIAYCKQQIKKGWLPPLGIERKLSRLNIHLIEAQEVMEQFDQESKLDIRPAFIQQLHGEGIRAASRWLRANFDHLRLKSSVDLVDVFC